MIDLDNLAITFIINLVIAYFISFYFTKKKILIDNKGYSEHKTLIKNTSVSPPLCGGIIIFINSIIFFQDLFLLSLFGFFLLLIGIFSDNNKISSPVLRIIFQLIVLVSFVVIINLNVNDLRIEFFNNLLTIKFISVIFTTFCILVLINGSNFLDGLNTLLVGYFILICSFLLILSNNYDLIINDNVVLLLVFLIGIYLFNFFGIFYLGDSGSYLISFYMGYFMIDFAVQNESVSPYLICFFLWYPAFENLFSIIRRSNLKKKIHLPDQKHLHQMFYIYVANSKIINHKITNTFVGNFINLFNFIMFLNFYHYFNNTKILLYGIFINIFLYLILYYLFKKKLIK